MMSAENHPELKITTLVAEVAEYKTHGQTDQTTTLTGQTSDILPYAQYNVLSCSATKNHLLSVST